VSLFDEEKITSELKGNTLRAYWALLNSKDGVIGVRELQRQLGFSSPTLAAYHLNKLVELELVVKERGNYRLEREVKVGVLKQFVKIGTFLLPRYVLYATMFTILLIFFLTQLGQRGMSFYSNFALILAILSTVIAWYETIRVWMQKP
jgi:hypothetical protein